MPPLRSSDALERWVRGPLEPDARATTLGSILVVREQPHLVLCDPYLFAGAAELTRAVPGRLERR